LKNIGNIFLNKINPNLFLGRIGSFSVNLKKEKKEKEKTSLPIRLKIKTLDRIIPQIFLNAFFRPILVFIF